MNVSLSTGSWKTTTKKKNGQAKENANSFGIMRFGIVFKKVNNKYLPNKEKEVAEREKKLVFIYKANNDDEDDDDDATVAIASVYLVILI